MNKHKKAFTLIELIITIIILAILGTIAFISFQGYSTSARDSTRISDLSSMKTSLELFQLDAGKYPETTAGFTVTYSGSEVWTQGIFGESTKSNVEKLDKIPKDPLTDKEYTYSITKTKQEYQLAGLIEGNEIVFNDNILLNQINAGEIIATAIVTGNYNGQTLKTETGVACEVLSIPSIISSEKATTDLETILNNKSLVYNGFNNLPSNYEGSKYKIGEGFDFESAKLVVYSDNQECKPLYDTENATARINLVKNLQAAYSGTLIENSENIRGLTSINLADTEAIKLLSTSIINNNLGGKITSFQSDSSLVATNGECGAADTKYRVNLPTTDMCTTGTAESVFTGTTSYNWSCSGINGGNAVNCSATILKKPTVGTNTASETNITWSWLNGGGIATKYEWSSNGTTWINKGTSINHTESSLTCNNSYSNRLVRACDDIGECSGNTTLTSTNTTACQVTCNGGITVGNSCGSVSAGGFTYTTKCMPDGKCWTTSNMKHTTTSGVTKCYDNDTSKCATDGRLYDLTSALHSSLCPALGTGWALPTGTQWTGLINAGATGRFGNKLFGLVSVLPGHYLYNSSTPFAHLGVFIGLRASDGNSLYLYSDNTPIYFNSFFVSQQGLSVVCIKN